MSTKAELAEFLATRTALATSDPSIAGDIAGRLWAEGWRRPETHKPDPRRTMTVWRSPSGLLHRSQGCSGVVGPRASLVRQHLPRDLFAELERCRCLNRFWPDAASEPGEFRGGYQVGIQDALQRKPQGDHEAMGADWQQGYEAGWQDTAESLSRGARL